jgi:NADH-quinone oxidoreductase subunit J
MTDVIHLIFYLFSFIAVCAGIAVITVRNPVHSVLSLVLAFFAMAGNWMLLRAEFLSLILILVYVGAVMTLFLFVVMMLNIDKESKKRSWVRYFPFGLVAVLLMVGLLVAVVGPKYFGITQMPAPPALGPHFSNVEHIGQLLFTDYAYPFEVAGAMLLAAIVAAIVLAHQGPTARKSQDVDAQVAATPAGRVRLVKMPPEPRQGL